MCWPPDNRSPNMREPFTSAERQYTMLRETTLTFFSRILLTCAFAAIPLFLCCAEPPDRSDELIQVGSMHEAIGKGQHQGRIEVGEVVGESHFYGVGALEGLRGEITILNSVATITGVAGDGHIQPIENTEAKATMLVGQYISDWSHSTLAEDVPHTQFDKTIAEMAARKGMDISEPFVFVAEGEFTDVRMHVINGACPVHARIRKLDIEPEKRPFEMEERTVRGTLVAVYAADAAGKLTHPATSTHAHLVYIDETTGERVTGHLEQVGLAKGAVLKLPESSEQGGAAERD